MDDAPWWPSGIITDDSADTESGVVQTVFGSIQCWNFAACLSNEWWQHRPESGDIWGDWPEVTTAEVIKHDRKGILLKLNDHQIARISPFAVGNDLSRLVQYQPWRQALEDLAIELPSMVYYVENQDRIAVYDCAEIVSGIESLQAERVADKLGSIHSALNEFSTPNTERRWNDRLKDIEAELKVTTLWRAPHSEYTVGLPRLNIDLATLSVDGEEFSFIADIRSLVEHLMCEPDRLPGLATLMLIEQQISFARGMTTAARKSLLQAYLNTAPNSYGRKKALSTLMGGPWIWRYHAVLIAFAEARIFGDEELGERAENWLNDVSRIQAHLGVLRLWKSGLWGGIIGAVIAFFAWRMETVSPTIAGIVAMFCLIGSLTCNMIYWSKDPKPY